jgi:cytochrome c oxidase cbb3-type subunit III
MKFIIGLVMFMVLLLGYRVLSAINSDDYNIYDKKISLSTEETPQEELQETGKSIYYVYCSSCHGMNGKGNNGKAQNHTERIAKKTIVDVIIHGSNNFKSVYPSGMPAGLLNEKEAKKVATYIVNKMQGEKPTSWEVCASCHDESGKGISLVAPNLYEYSDELVATVLTNGKKGVIGTMPNFSGRLSKMQMKALASHIRSLQR